MQQTENELEPVESAEVQALTDEELAMVGGARIGGGGTGAAAIE